MAACSPEQMCVTIKVSQAILDKTRSACHSHCAVCGRTGADSLGIRFLVQEDGTVAGRFDGRECHQGYDGYLHGGLIATLVDSAMTNCLFAHGRVAMTGDLCVRFLKPVVTSSPTVVSAWIERSLPPLFKMNGEVRQHGEIMARATAKFMEVRISDRGMRPKSLLV